MPRANKTRRLRQRRRGASQRGGIQSTRRRPSRSPSPIPQIADADVTPLDPSDYRNALIHQFIQPDHDSTSPSGDAYVSYKVEDALRPFLHDYFVFQTPVDFDFDWLRESKNYVRGLTVFEKYILRAYTRHGDELVNAYLRDAPGFQTNPRVLELLFTTMPANYNLPFASILAYDHISQNMDRSYIEDDFFDDSGDVRELGQRIQQTFIQDVLQVQPVNWSRVYELMDRYIQAFQDILHSAPRPPRNLLVFRGVQTDYMNRVQEAVPLVGFTSTTYSLDIAASFAKGGKQVYEMLLLAGTPCLCLDEVSEFEGTECEILVDTHVYAMAEKKFEKKRLHPAMGFAEPLQADTVLDTKGPSFYSRLVVLHPQQDQLGGGHVGGRATQKKWKSARSLKSRSRKTKSKKKAVMYARADPVPQWGAPVPQIIQQRLRDVLLAHRPKRT